MRSFSVVVALGLVASLAAAQPAPRRPRAIAIVALEIGGDAAPELREPIQKSLLRGLADGGVRAVSLDAAMAKLAGNHDLVGCVSITCLGQMADVLGVSELLRGRIEGSGTNYSIALELLSPGAEGGIERRVEDTCAVCTISDLDQRVAALTGRLLGETTVELTEVVIASSPAGASLTIDGRPVGTAPFSGKLAEGDHRVHAVLAGRGTVDQTIAVGARGDEPRRFELVLPALQLTAADRPFRTWKWLGAGGSVALLAIGIGLLAVDGEPTCGDIGDRECKSLRDTKLAGVLSVGGGVALGGFTSWMFYRDHADRGARVEVAPTASGAAVGMSWRF
jgi:hypothetical protein